MPTGGQKDSTKTDTRDSADLVKDVRQEEISNILDKHTVQTNPFGHNISAENAYRRAERVAAALHLITAHIPENEPVRGFVRRESTLLLGHILNLRSQLRAAKSEEMKRAQVSVRKIISYIRLLGAAGYVSVQNTQVLIGALDELGVLLVTSQRSALSEDVVMTREDLVPRLQEVSATKREERQPTHQSKSSSYTQRRPVDQREVTIKDSKRTVTGDRSDRILDVLRTGGLLGIKDIASNLPEYSEKMIQRELASLVSNDRVRKFGAKRWSKYEVVR